MSQEYPDSPGLFRKKKLVVIDQFHGSFKKRKMIRSAHGLRFLQGHVTGRNHRVFPADGYLKDRFEGGLVEAGECSTGIGRFEVGNCKPSTSSGSQ